MKLIHLNKQYKYFPNNWTMKKKSDNWKAAIEYEQEQIHPAVAKCMCLKAWKTQAEQ